MERSSSTGEIGRAEVSQDLVLVLLHFLGKEVCPGKHVKAFLVLE